MQDRASPPVPATSADNVVAVPGVLEAVIRALAAALASSGAQPAQPGEPADGRPLLDLEETAELLGVSHMTVARMADEGRLPSVVIRRGRVQRIRRIPRAFVDQMIANVCAGHRSRWRITQLPGSQNMLKRPVMRHTGRTRSYGAQHDCEMAGRPREAPSPLTWSA